jgi:hypothetical protein
MPLSTALRVGAFATITTNYADDCRLANITFTVSVTSATGYGGTSFGDPNMTVLHCGRTSTTSGCGQTSTFSFAAPAAATGNSIGGTSCRNLFFDTAAPPPAWNPSAPPPAPYVGKFQWDPARTEIGRDYMLRNLDLDLVNTFDHPPDAVLECAQFVITTKIVP